MQTAMVRYQLSGALRVAFYSPAPICIFLCLPTADSQLPGTMLFPGLLAKVTLLKGSISQRLEWPVVASLSASLMASGPDSYVLIVVGERTAEQFKKELAA